ncbi:MAG TPA: C25 family cysteine peptidase [Polyangia bacterium]|nr:C25 family cysteine peptidase [Polyangia bacterium]
MTVVAATSIAARAATPSDEQATLAAAGAIKIVARGRAWLRVGQPALVAAGLDPHVDPRTLRLFADGVEHAIVVTGNGDATFSADEAIELYGVGRDTLSTDERTYWLVSGGAAGARVATPTAAIGGAPPTYFGHAEPLVERTVYLSSIRNGETSNFYGAALSATPVMKTIAAHDVDAAHVATAQLRVDLQGITATSHAIDVSLNGTVLGTALLDQQARGTFSFGAPNVVEGNNQIQLVSHGSSADFTALGAITLAYPHLYLADGDELLATAPAATHLAIGGFSTSDVRVIDVTDEANPVELSVTISASTPFGALVDLPDDGALHTVYAFTAAHVGAPARVVADAPSTWGTSHDGDLLVLSNAAFLASVQPLVDRRRQEGWSVQLVDLQDVYDELGFGDKSPDAVRAFIMRARAAWRVPPRFVLLVGDATFDPRNFLGKGDFDFAPTKLIDTATMETASDDWFGDADGDGVPEVAMGRFPARTTADVDAVVAKTLGFAGAVEVSRGALFVSDVDGTDLDFTGASAASAAKVADLMPVTQFSAADAGSTSAALVKKLNDGPFLVNYFGHGSVEVWDNLFSSAQASALTNPDASIYVVMNCLNGFFHDLYTTSLAESLLQSPSGGAVGVWASSTLADFVPQPAYNQEFLMRLTRTSIGEAALAAKRAITDVEARKTWIYFGDPTLFGTPAAIPDAGVAVDAAADGAADGGASDAPVGAVDAGATDADAAMATDGGLGDASTDAAIAADADADATTSMDAATTDAALGDAAGGDHTGATPGGGCSCDVGGMPGTPARAGFFFVAAIALATRRRRARPRRSGAAARAVGAAALLVAILGGASTARAAYSYRKAITIDRTRIGATGAPTTLTNYPLLLDITDSALATTGHVTNLNGYDISFQGADTTTCGGPSTCTFNYEIESYTAATGHVIAWVQIPALKTVSATSNTVIYVKYGDASVTTPTQNATGTWDTSFQGVWHLNQATSPQSDSTSTPANAAYGGTTTPATTTGKIGSGVATTGTTGDGYLDYRSTKFNYTATDTFTYSAWFNTTDSSGPIFSQRDNGAGNPVIDINIGYDGGTTAAGKLTVLIRSDAGGTPYAEYVGTTTVSDGAWHNIVVTRSTSTVTVYLDGALAGLGTGSAAAGTITTGSTGNYQNIGREGNWVAASYGTTDQRYLAGSFDELRISKTIRSIDWITTDYNTQGTPASTFSLGAEALASCGDGTRIAGESCDDGNIVSGDGCSSTCTTETGYTCNTATPNVCTTFCSDGVVAGTEACDDGNLTNGDGCSSTCTVESTYVCTGSPSTCKLGRFDYYKIITIDRTKVGTATSPTTLSNYPILFSVTDPSLKSLANGGRLRATTATKPYDIAFQGFDATVCGGPTECTLAHEIESYDPTTGTIIAWVNVPGLNAQTNTGNTQIRLLMGNKAISTTTEQITSTWNSSFKGVWHLNQTPSGSGAMTDSTSNANNGTPNGTVTQASSARIGAGVTFDGSTGYIATNSGTSLDVASGGSFTLSAWLNTSDSAGALWSFRSSTSSNQVIDFMVGRDGKTTTANMLMILARDDSNGGLNDVFTSTSIATGTWHYVSATHSGTSLSLYVDANLINTVTISSGSFTNDTRNMGREGRWVQDNYTTTAEEFLAATVDEYRMSNTARTIDWITTDYNNQLSPSTFYTYTTGAAGEIAGSSFTVTELVAMDASEGCDGTTVTWRTGYEIDTLGFNVYREVNGARVQLNPSLIEAAGLSGGGGHAYSIVDPGSADAGRRYWIEDVSFDLASELYGPIAPTSAGACGSKPTAQSPAEAVAAGSAAPSPIATTSAAAPIDAAPEAGGCTIAAHGSRAPISLIGIALGLALARRRRR